MCFVMPSMSTPPSKTNKQTNKQTNERTYIGGLNYATLWCSGASQKVHHQKPFWGIENQILRSDLLDAFSIMCSPRRAGKRTPQNCKMFGSYRLHNGFTHLHIHIRAINAPGALNTSPTCFEGPRGREIRFRDTDPENRLYVLHNLIRRKYVYKCVW